MKTFQEFSQYLEENKLTRYMAKKAAKQVMGASNKLFSGKKSLGAKFLKKSPEGQNIRQSVANALRGNKGIGTTHAQTKNLPRTRRMSEFELSKLDKQMNQSAGRFIPGVKSGENFQAYKSPNEFYKTDMRATAKKAGAGEMLKQYDDLSKKSTADRFVDAARSDASNIKPSDAANVLKKRTLSKGIMKRVERSGIEPVINNQQTLDRHLRMRNMSKKNIRKANEYRDQKNLVRAIFGGKRSKRIGPTKQHRLRAQDTAIMTRSKANSDTGYLDILGGNPESMTNTLGKRSYASIQKGKIPQPKGSKKTKTPKWVKSLNRYDDDFEFGKVDVKK